MENTEIKKGIKSCTCYYLDSKTKFDGFDFDNILLDEKSYENILIYDVLYKTLIDTKLSHIMLDDVDGFIRNYDGVKYFSIVLP